MALDTSTDFSRLLMIRVRQVYGISLNKTYQIRAIWKKKLNIFKKLETTFEVFVSRGISSGLTVIFFH